MNGSLIALAAAFLLVVTGSAASAYDKRVACIQSNLDALGFDPGSVDGALGPKTISAYTDARDSGLRLSVKELDTSLNLQVSCRALARIVAEKADWPSLVHIADVPYSHPAFQSVRDGIAAVSGYLGSRFPVTVYSFRNRQALLETYSGFSRVSTQKAAKLLTGLWAWAGYQKLYVNLSRFGPNPLSRRVAGHEYVHGYQYSLLGRGNVNRDDGKQLDGPQWLIEGMAEWVSFEAIGAPRQITSSSRSPEELTSWRQFQDARKRSDPYAAAERMVAHLIQEAGEDKVLREYWQARRERGYAELWEDTFERVFGFSVDRFNSDFQQQE